MDSDQSNIINQVENPINNKKKNATRSEEHRDSSSISSNNSSNRSHQSDILSLAFSIGRGHNDEEEPSSSSSSLQDSVGFQKPFSSWPLEPTLVEHSSSGATKTEKTNNNGSKMNNKPGSAFNKRDDVRKPPPTNTYLMAAATIDEQEGDGLKPRVFYRRHKTITNSSSSITPLGAHGVSTASAISATTTSSAAPSWREKRRIFSNANNNNNPGVAPPAARSSTTTPGAIYEQPSTNPSVPVPNNNTAMQTDPTEPSTNNNASTTIFGDMPLLEATVVQDKDDDDDDDNDNDDVEASVRPARFNISMAMAQPEPAKSLCMTHGWQILILVGVLAALIGGITSTKVVRGGKDSSPTTTTTTSPPMVVSTTSAPTATAQPTTSPTPRPLLVFETTRELYNAVDEYARDPGPNSTVAVLYGHPIGSWNVSQIRDFSRLFEADNQGRNPDLNYFNEDISEWDTGSATTMSRMFKGKSQLGTVCVLFARRASSDCLRLSSSLVLPDNRIHHV